VITVCRQSVSLDRVHAGRIITVHVPEHTLAIELARETRTVRRTTVPCHRFWDTSLLGSGVDVHVVEGRRRGLAAVRLARRGGLTQPQIPG